MQLRHSIEIASPPARVWPLLVEPENQKLWMKGLLESQKMSEGPTRAGSRFVMKIREGFRTATYDGEITACERSPTPLPPAPHSWLRFQPISIRVSPEARTCTADGSTRTFFRIETMRYAPGARPIMRA